MKLKNLLFPNFSKLSKEYTLNSQRLMLRAGMIKQVSSGVYSWLPLGVKMLNKLTTFIRNELNFFNCQEVILPSLQPIELWEKSGRYKKSSKDTQMFNLFSNSKEKYVLPVSCEELITETIKNLSFSHKDMSRTLYQITWKFRNELRPKKGLLRSKEFLMKDAYSFDINRINALKNYEKMLKVYILILKKLKLKVIPVLANTNNIGGDYSHEIHILSKNGDEKIFYEKNLIRYLDADNFELYNYEKFYVMTKEKHLNNISGKLNILRASSIEVGHIFYLGQKYTRNFNFFYQDDNRNKKFPEMCCYGIGISRLLLLIIENSYNGKDLILPNEILPFEVFIINTNKNNLTCVNLSEQLYCTLSCKYDVLCSTVEQNFRKQLSFIKLVGVCAQVVIWPKYAVENFVELVSRGVKKSEFIHINKLEKRMECLKGIEPLSLDP